MIRSQTYRVLLRAEQVPTGWTITKRGGDKRYTIYDEITIYGPNEAMEDPPPTRQVTPSNGCRYLIAREESTDGTFPVNLIPSDTLVLCDCTFITQEDGRIVIDTIEGET